MDLKDKCLHSFIATERRKETQSFSKYKRGKDNPLFKRLRAAFVKKIIKG